MNTERVTPEDQVVSALRVVRERVEHAKTCYDVGGEFRVCNCDHATRVEQAVARAVLRAIEAAAWDKDALPWVVSQVRVNSALAALTSEEP